MVHCGFSAAGQLVTLVYRGKINDLTLWSAVASNVSAVAIVGSGGRAVERRTVKRGDGGSIPPTTVSKRRQFRSPHICLSFSEWSHLSGVYARGSKISHTGGKFVTCSRLTHFRWPLNALQRPVQYLTEENHELVSHTYHLIRYNR